MTRSIAYIPQQVRLPSTPATPDAGFSRLYQKQDGDWYQLDNTGLERFVFSPNFVFFTNDAIGSQTTTTFVDHINENTPVLPAGTYELLTSFAWNYDGTTTDFLARLLIDGVSVDANTTEIIRQEAKDNVGTFGITGTDQKMPFMRVDYVVFATAAARNIQLSFASSQNGVRASMWSSRVSLKRVQ